MNGLNALTQESNLKILKMKWLLNNKWNSFYQWTGCWSSYGKNQLAFLKCPWFIQREKGNGLQEQPRFVGKNSLTRQRHDAIRREHSSVTTHKKNHIEYRKHIPAPAAAPDPLVCTSKLCFACTSTHGRRWSSSSPIWCSFLHASRHTSCLDVLELWCGGPTIVWKTAFGGRISLHSYGSSDCKILKIGFGL